jgi:chaperonin GroES
MKVVGNRLLVRFVEKEQKDNGGIVVTGQAEEVSDRAEVVLVGNEVEEGLVSKGDVVVVSHAFGNEVDLNGDKCNVVNMENVLVVL